MDSLIGMSYNFMEPKDGSLTVVKDDGAMVAYSTKFGVFDIRRSDFLDAITTGYVIAK